MSTPAFDLYALPENERINVIGKIAEQSVTGVMLEKNEPAKVRRYIEKVTKRFPKVRHIDTTDVENMKSLVVMVRFGPKLDA